VVVIIIVVMMLMMRMMIMLTITVLMRMRMVIIIAMLAVGDDDSDHHHHLSLPIPSSSSSSSSSSSYSYAAVSHVFDLLFSWASQSNSSRLVSTSYQRSESIHPSSLMEVEDGWVGLRSNTSSSSSPPSLSSSSSSSSSLIKTKGAEEGGREGIAEMMHFHHHHHRVELTSMWRVMHLTAMRCFEWEQVVFFHHQGGEGTGISLSGHEVPINALHRMEMEMGMGMESEVGVMKKSISAVLLRDIVQDFALSGRDGMGWDR
jgi:hypothetical protein